MQWSALTHHRTPPARKQESLTNRCRQTPGERGGGRDHVPGREAAPERGQWGGGLWTASFPARRTSGCFWVSPWERKNGTHSGSDNSNGSNNYTAALNLSCIVPLDLQLKPYLLRAASVLAAIYVMSFKPLNNSVRQLSPFLLWI